MVGEVWQIGDVKVTRVVEIEATGGMSRIIPDAKRELVREIDPPRRFSIARAAEHHRAKTDW